MAPSLGLHGPDLAKALAGAPRNAPISPEKHGWRLRG